MNPDDYDESPDESVCRHAQTKVTRLTTGVHYGKEMCVRCGKFLRWVGAPQPQDLAKLNVPSHQGAWPGLKGTERQIRWAQSIREDMLRQFKTERVENRFLQGLVTITDAAWWIANRERSFQSLHWPNEWLPREEPPVEVEPAVKASTERLKGMSARLKAVDITDADLEAEIQYIEKQANPFKRVPPIAKAPTIASAVGRMTATVTKEDGMFHLSVSFDGRTTGTLRMTEEELIQLHGAVGEAVEGLRYES